MSPSLNGLFSMPPPYLSILSLWILFGYAKDKRKSSIFTRISQKLKKKKTSREGNIEIRERHIFLGFHLLLQPAVTIVFSEL
ncbi:hypothetical protein Pfo_023841 [Paulownia fortunei]|nr:hypothetical protein Pfo_023841 [Paulownia fortunei]